MWQATRLDLVTLGGLPASAYASDARQIANAYVAPASVFELPSNGFNAGAPIRFSVMPGSVLYAGIGPLAWYTTVATTDPDFFSIVDGNGNPVALTDTGTGSIFCVENIWPKIDQRLAARTSWVIASATAYQGPWTTPPGWAPQLVAALVAADVAPWLRLPERYPLELLEKRYDEAQTFLATKLFGGAPYSDGVGPVDATPLVADNGAVAIELEGRDFLGHGRQKDRA